VTLDEHVAAAFARSELLLDPFPHLVVEGLFPEADYQHLLANLPQGREWNDVGKFRTNWNIDTDPAAAETQRVWRAMHQEIAPRVLIPNVVDRFRPYLRGIWAARGEDGDALEPHYRSIEGRLLMRRPGYKLPPHLDPHHGLMTVLIYLARPGEDEQFGTDLYRGTPPADYEGIYKPIDAGLPHDYARTVPFRPNTMLAFLTPISLHGATFPRTATFERVAYQFQIALDKAARKAVQARAAARSAASTPSADQHAP
jgi:hypothetical protein